eukprot:TRINITY_DN25047_c0_g2_i1.p1 TRINITY_DN25047_c0_g2~~TRINITY_DN25047_c0_g2_i1.p1  ORF type:complete len:349 (+),score=35.62 TRINITY_DN25047_c0_g2_i1:400-1446(+)
MDEMYWCDDPDATYHTVEQTRAVPPRFALFPVSVLGTAPPDPIWCHHTQHSYPGDAAVIRVSSSPAHPSVLRWSIQQLYYFIKLHNKESWPTHKLLNALLKLTTPLGLSPPFPAEIGQLIAGLAPVKPVQQWWVEHASLLKNPPAHERGNKIFVPKPCPVEKLPAIVDGFAVSLQPADVVWAGTAFEHLVHRAIPGQGRTMSFGTSTGETSSSCLAVRATTLKGSSGSPCTVEPSLPETDLTVHAVHLGGCPGVNSLQFSQLLQTAGSLAATAKEREAAVHEMFQYDHNLCLLLTSRCCAMLLRKVLSLPEVDCASIKESWGQFAAYVWEKHGIRLFPNEDTIQGLLL